MRRLNPLMIVFVAAIATAQPSSRPTAIILADESVRIEDGRPAFTANQVANCSAATRDGLARWAATDHGRAILDRLSPAEYSVVVTENTGESSPGRAPQPGLATLAAAGDHSRLKVYEVVVNPALFHPVNATVAVVPPLTAADMMALAWAAEMLHVDFYSRGISLPHHRREDFQREWRDVATELGMPNVRHDDESDERQPEAQPDWRSRPVRRPAAGRY